MNERQESICVVGRVYQISYPWWAKALRRVACVLQRMAESGMRVEPWGKGGGLRR